MFSNLNAKEKKQKLSFLDCLVTRDNGQVSTSVYVKSSNCDKCLNYKSLCPQWYKESTIRTLLHRAYHICSNWQLFDLEVRRIKQHLVNNQNPIQIIDSCISKLLNTKIQRDLNRNKDTNNKQANTTDNEPIIFTDNSTIITDGQVTDTGESAVLDASTGDKYMVNQHHNIERDFVRKDDRTTKWTLKKECNNNNICKSSSKLSTKKSRYYSQNGATERRKHSRNSNC